MHRPEWTVFEATSRQAGANPDTGRVTAMPMSGSKPKPRDQIRHRVKPVLGWTDVVDVPYTGAVPALPARPRQSQGPRPPKPWRPLGDMGTALWKRTWLTAGSAAVDAEALLVLCEQMDERVALRLEVLEYNNWRTRTALRALDQQVAAGLNALGLATARTVPSQWPAETLRWWETVSHMPHCVLWTDADWRFAIDSALVAATLHCGDVRAAAELRQREKIMGTTGDARRDLRIRYVDAVADNADSATVTAMDTYRRIATGK